MAVDKFPHTERGIRRTSYPLVPRRDGSIDVKGREIKIQKSVEIKEFPRGWTVWSAVSPLGFFCFSQYAETNPRFKMSEG